MPLTICIVAFSVCSVLSGLAASFAVLLAACLLMGIAEGPILPRLSDRIGRKPVIVATYSIGFIIPISLLTWYGSALLLAPLIFVGACVGGAMSLFMGGVPSETVPARLVAIAAACAMKETAPRPVARRQARTARMAFDLGA